MDDVPGQPGPGVQPGRRRRMAAAGAGRGVVVLAIATRRIVRALRTLPALALTPIRPATCPGGSGRATTRTRSSSGRTAPGRRGPAGASWGSSAWPGSSGRSTRNRSPGDTRSARCSRTCASPTPAGCPFPFARFMREHFDPCTVVTASDGPRLRDLDGHWTLDVGGSYGVNVAGFGALQGVDGAGPGARARSRSGAGTAPPGRRREHRAAPVRVAARRGVLSHERHRSGHGGRAPGAVQHAPEAHRVLLRRLSRLVGRRAARAGQ